jgi:hypothetical protein
MRRPKVIFLAFAKQAQLCARVDRGSLAVAEAEPPVVVGAVQLRRLNLRVSTALLMKEQQRLQTSRIALKCLHKSS